MLLSATLTAPFAAGASHALAALAFLLLAALLVPGWRQGRHATPLLAACALTALWAATAAAAVFSGDFSGTFSGAFTGRAVSAALDAGGPALAAGASAGATSVLQAAGGAAAARAWLMPAAEALEAVRTVAWLVFLLSLLGRSGPSRKGLLAAAVAVALLPLAYGELAWMLQPGTAELADAAQATAPGAGRTGAPIAAQAAIPAVEQGGAPTAAQAAGPDAVQAARDVLLPIICRVVLAVGGLLLLEQLYRGTPAHERWAIKFACLGIGLLFAYDFYLYSDALLFRRMSAELWAARGLVCALGAPLLAVAAARNPRWSVGLALSRQMLFRSAALIGSALYLLAMAGCAWYLRSFGGAWGPLMQVAWMAGAAIVLAGVLFSGAMRAHAKVFISKHFYQTGFDYREEWQRFTRTLSLEGPDLGLRAVQALAALVESPAGALWLRRNDAAGDRCEPSACWNLARQHGDASAAFCQFLEQRQWVLDVPESLAQPERYAGLELPPWLHGVSQLWLLVPLMLHGRLYGVVALTQPRTALELNWEVRDLLKIAGSQAAS